MPQDSEVSLDELEVREAGEVGGLCGVVNGASGALDLVVRG